MCQKLKYNVRKSVWDIVYLLMNYFAAGPELFVRYAIFHSAIVSVASLVQYPLFAQFAEAGLENPGCPDEVSRNP